VRDLAHGDVLTAAAGVVAGMYVVLTGRLTISVNRGTGLRPVMEWVGGDITGMLPYSRLKAPPADVLAQEPSSVVLLGREHLDAMTRECPGLTAVCVHVMVDRARAFTSSDLLDEKMASLGRLAAGMAHELNNPASAVARNASSLEAALTDLQRATRAFCSLGLPEPQCEAVEALRTTAAAAAAAGTLSPIDRADRQDAVADWLADHDMANVDADRLVDAGWTLDYLQQLDTLVGPAAVGIALAYLATEHHVLRLATDVERAASRIHDLVSAVKRFTYMDQAMVTAPTAIAPGLADTVTMLGSKARQKDVTLRLEVAPDLPKVEALGGELNQVWTNLIDNAIDAVPRGGHVVVSASSAGERVVVHVADNGPGIPAAIRARVFDPFFTTKDVGSGTGLGLDIARRLVLRHRGTIDFTTGDTGTTFHVSLPTAAPPSAS